MNIRHRRGSYMKLSSFDELRWPAVLDDTQKVVC
jgi:hypothetical protein